MLHPSLMLLALLTQGDAVPRSSAGLTADTLLAIEVPPSSELPEEAITQLALLQEVDRCGFFAWLGQNDPRFAGLWSHREQAQQVLGSFDQGMTAAYAFCDDARGGRSLERYLIGAASHAKRTRSLVDLCAELMANPDPRARALTRTRQSIADSPAQFVMFERNLTSSTWTVFNRLTVANRGRVAGLRVDRGDFTTLEPDSEDRQGRERTALRQSLAQMIGLTHGGEVDDRFAPRLPLAAGQTLLARSTLRFRACATAENGFSPGDAAEMRVLGLSELTGWRSTLWREGDGVHDRVDLHYEKGDGSAPSLFALLRPGKTSLGDDATRLPASALAVVRFGGDVAGLAALAAPFVARDLQTTPPVVLAAARRALGLQAGEGAGFESLDTVTLLLLAPSAESSPPEPALVVRVPGREHQIEECLLACGELLANALGQPKLSPAADDLKTLGTEEAAVTYLALKPMLVEAVGTSGAIATSSLVGGGFFAATRCGELLIVGCNPRTVRMARDSIAEQQVLATRPEVMARFPAGARRALEAWIDLPGVIERLGFLHAALPVFATRMLRGIRGAKTAPPVPKLGDVAQRLGRECLWIEPGDSSLVLHVTGGTLLSPTAWAATLWAVEATDTLCRSLR